MSGSVLSGACECQSLCNYYVLYLTHRRLTEEERVKEGLLGRVRQPCLEVIDFELPKGRGVVAKEAIKKGGFVCEYRTYRVYPVGSKEAQSLARQYELNSEGSYIIETSYPVPGVGCRLAFDATRRYQDIARLINHKALSYNLKPFKPMYIRNKWRIGMVAVRDINVDDELTYDYGVRSESWMKVRATEMSKETKKTGGDEGERNVNIGAEEDIDQGPRAGADEDMNDEAMEDSTGDQAQEVSTAQAEDEENDREDREMSRNLWIVSPVKHPQNKARPRLLSDEEEENDGKYRETDEDVQMVSATVLETPRSRYHPTTSRKLFDLEETSEDDWDTREDVMIVSTTDVQEERVDGVKNGVVDDEEEVQILSTVKSKKPKRNYFWCPVTDCTSGPVQKITQHLQKKHRMAPAKSAALAKKKRRAPREAIRLNEPNPHTRSSGMKSLALTFSESASTPAPAHQAITPHRMPSPSPGSSRTTTPTIAPSHPVPPCTPSTSGLSGKFHDGDFIKSLYSHLRTRAGGFRGNKPSKQICRYVGKYLYFLNPSKVEENALLDPTPVEGYLAEVEGSGVGCSGVLHRLLSHKAAVNFMRLTVRSFSFDV